MSEDSPRGAPKVTAHRGPWYENPSGWFVAGYGPFRRLSGAASEAQRLMLGHKRTASLVTLFDESASLAESLWWLQDIYPKSLEGDRSFKKLLSSVLSIMNDGLLPDEFEISRYDSYGLWVERNGIELGLQEMSDGYRTVSALILDIVRRIYTAHGHFELKRSEGGGLYAPYEGVVLIDEIDVHLHVSWQQRIGFWLREHFPNIQFIVSTHSPFICQAASPKGLIRLPPPDEPESRPRFIEDRLFNVIVNGGADRAVISELFGLDTPRSREAEGLRQHLRGLEEKVARSKGSREALEDEIEETREVLGVSPSDDVAAALSDLNRSLGR